MKQKQKVSQIIQRYGLGSSQYISESAKLSKYKYRKMKVNGTKKEGRAPKIRNEMEG